MEKTLINTDFFRHGLRVRHSFSDGGTRINTVVIPAKAGIHINNSSVFSVFSVAKSLLPAFTLVEVMIVLVIVGIIAAIAVPMYTSAASVQLSSAADMIASDLEYAKSMAISTGQTYQVVFNTAAESYSIKNAFGQVIAHPVRVGQTYVVSFASDSRLNKVDIVSATFGASATITFDYLGSPDNGGSILLRAEGNTMTVTIEPVTGYIAIQ